jgi:hypothetical protein
MPASCIILVSVSVLRFHKTIISMYSSLTSQSVCLHHVPLLRRPRHHRHRRPEQPRLRPSPPRDFPPPMHRTGAIRTVGGGPVLYRNPLRCRDYGVTITDDAQGY